MAYLISLVILIVTILFGVSVGSDGVSAIVLFFNAPSLILVLLPTLGVPIAAMNRGNLRIFPILFGNQSISDPQELKRVFNFFGSFGDTAVLMGIIAIFISNILLLADLGNINMIGPNMAVGICSMLYAVVLKLVGYLAQCHVRTKAEISHDTLNQDNRIWLTYIFVFFPMVFFCILLFVAGK
ncbi:hypothetical protein KKI24_22760 [bacterium]|nr:hypothetical protein [bacterium]